jgi:5'-3' exoribonuclease 2
LPSLDIRDGALDYLFNVYKRILPSLGDYITNHGGQVNLSHVDVILAEVGSIEDHVFSMKHSNEERDKERREQFKARKKQANGRSLNDPRTAIQEKQPPKVMGKAAKILEKQKEKELASSKKGVKSKIKPSHIKGQDNLQAAMALKESLNERGVKVEEGEDSVVKVENVKKEEEIDMDVDSENKDESKVKIENETESAKKRKFEAVDKDTNEPGVGLVGNAEDEFGTKDEDDDEEEVTEEVSIEVASAFKERVKDEQKKKLDEYAKNVDDKVRLHETGWKDRYYTDKCKADDVANHGGRDHLFRSYVMGLCWVMKYYYEGCKFIFILSTYMEFSIATDCI